MWSRPSPQHLVPQVLVVTVWFENPEPSGFRARVSATSAGGDMVGRHVTADPGTVPVAVAAWLTELLEPEKS